MAVCVQKRLFACAVVWPSSSRVLLLLNFFVFLLCLSLSPELLSFSIAVLCCETTPRFCGYPGTLKSFFFSFFLAANFFLLRSGGELRKETLCEVLYLFLSHYYGMSEKPLRGGLKNEETEKKWRQ